MEKKWIFGLGYVDKVSDMPEGTFGFVYKITNMVSGKFYIGKKQLFSTTKRNFGKKELAQITDKRKSKFEYVTKESNWLTYTGSNKELNSDIKKDFPIKREILWFCKNKSELTYFETKFQFFYGVIERESYNDNILGKFYRKIFE